MQTTDQVAGEAREKLAGAIKYTVDRLRSTKSHWFGYSSTVTADLALLINDNAEEILAALRAQPERGAEEWNYDMSAAPVGPDNSVLITVPSLFEGCPPIVGEAWYCTEEAGEGWWWSGSGPTIYHASPISETNAEPIAWRYRPEPAALRALPLHPAKDEGGGHG